jgi:hypothetical protein
VNHKSWSHLADSGIAWSVKHLQDAEKARFVVIENDGYNSRRVADRTPKSRDNSTIENPLFPWNAFSPIPQGKHL